MAKIQISIEDESLMKIDQFAKSIGLNRSRFLQMAALEYIRAKDTAPKITEIFSKAASIVNDKVSGRLSAEDADAQLSFLEAQAEELKKI